jgi:hypothetical protein
VSEIRLVPDPPKLNLIQRVLAMDAKPIALIALGVSLLSLYVASGRKVEGLEKAAELVTREAMTTGTGGP